MAYPVDANRRRLGVHPAIGQLTFLTFSCYCRRPTSCSAFARRIDPSKAKAPVLSGAVNRH